MMQIIIATVPNTSHSAPKTAIEPSSQLINLYFYYRQPVVLVNFFLEENV